MSSSTDSSANHPAAGAAALAARLDELPLSRFHWRVLLLSGLGWMFDALDILILGGIVAAVSTAWNLDPSTAAWISSINLIGMFVGATLAGLLADRIGRKAMFQATLLLYSIFTGLSAFAFNAGSLMVLRLLAGIGLGGELPVASTLVAEFAPSNRRGALVVLLESFWAYGAVLAALVGYVVVPRTFGSLEGWQVAFLIGALPAFLVFALRRGLPESVRFLVSRGRLQEAEEIVRQVERESGVESPPLQFAEGTTFSEPQGADVSASRRFRELFSPVWRRRTVVLWTMWATMNFSYYGIFLWLPTQFVRKGFSLDEALLFNLLIALAQIPGYFAAAFLVERWGRKMTLLSFLTACAAGAFFFGQQARQPVLGPEDIPAILLWGSMISFFNLGAWGVVYSYTPELYPTRLRATGAGAASAFGRLWGILAPLTIGWQIALIGSDATVFFVFMAVMLTGAAIVAVLGEETKGRSLESLEQMDRQTYA
jgi:putative MFS transporter